jgi:hypothetical protein
MPCSYTATNRSIANRVGVARIGCVGFLATLAWCVLCTAGAADDQPQDAAVAKSSETDGRRPASSAVADFREKVEPLLSIYCYDCHGNGASEGGMQLDDLTDASLFADHERWSKVLKNVRARVMPPAESERPLPEDVEVLANWIKYGALGIDPNDFDPGPTTIHRLNRIEYRNTIFDLVGVDYNITDEFPTDATGLGFDNIAELLSVSPLMLEKYLNAAEAVLEGAFPPETSQAFVVEASEIRGNNRSTGERLSFGGSPEITFTYRNVLPGAYRVVVDMEVVGVGQSRAERDSNETAEKEWDAAEVAQAASEPRADAEDESGNDEPEQAAKPGRLAFTVQSGTSPVEVLFDQKFAPQSKSYEFAFDQVWTTEPHKFDFNVITPEPEGGRRGFGLGGRRRGGRGNSPPAATFRINSLTITPKRPAQTYLYFPDDAPPAEPAAFRDYVKKGLTSFGLRAYRRPIDSETVELLTADVEAAYRETSSFNASIKPALAKVLCSPRFLFRIDRPAPEADPQAPWALVDEYSLASRLSYFLWSSMPDDELLDLAAKGELRANLDAQVQRMIASEKSQNFIENFSGQWLQTRNILYWSVVESAVLARENQNTPYTWMTPGVRQAMVDETTLYFARVFREDRSILEFIDSDYTYLNEDLAWYYELGDEIKGPQMRLVTLPENSPRGGVITQAGPLLVTSNANRTSPVKRGVYVLENFLGLQPHDPPPNVPALDDAAAGKDGKELSFRETLERHRADPLCASCHKLMDPIGLALENFNAIGTFRKQEFGEPIDASGTLVTGEEFKDANDLKQILMTSHRENFYRCLTEKVLTYALGREVGYYDTETVDQIVARLEAENGRFSVLLRGVIDSAAFQKRRSITPPATAVSSAAAPVSTTGEVGSGPDRRESVE